MNRFFVSIYRFFSVHKPLMYALLVFSTVFFGFFASKVRFDENIATLLPKADKSSNISIAFEDVKIKDKVILEVLPSGESEMTPKELADAMGSFMSLLDERDTSGYISNCLFRFDDDDFMNVLYYALGALPCHLGPEFYDYLDKNLNEEYIDAMSSGEISPELPDIGSYTMIDGQMFTKDSTMALAFLSPSFNSLDTKTGTKFEKLLASCVREYKASDPSVEILYHGAVIEGVYNSAQIKKDLLLTVGISLIIICLIFVLVFRSRNTVLHLLMPVIYGSVSALACVYWIKGSMSLIAMGIGAIILGVALSYCLHVIIHFKFVADAETVLSEESRPVCLGCLTTIGAFAGLLLTSSDLLKDFGMFASFALVGTTLFSLVFLPHFFRPSDAVRNDKVFALVDRVNSYPLDRNKVVVTFLVVLSIVCIFMSYRVGFDSDLSNIGYRDPKMVLSESLYNEKVNDSHFCTYYAAHSSDLDSAIVINRALCQKLDSLKETGLVYGYNGIDGLLIPEDEQRENIRLWKEYWTEDRIESTYSLLRKESAKHAWSTGDFDVAETFRLMAESDFEPQSLYDSGALPESLMCNFVEQVDDGWLVFTSVLLDRKNVMEAGDAVSSMDNIIVLDPFYYAGDMVKVVHNDFNVVLLVSSIFVFIVLLLSFRSLILSLIAFLPMALSWYIVKGLMAVFGLDFNLINIMISTFIFGVGVDYSIFVMEGLLNNARSQSGRLLLCHKSAIFFSGIILLIVVSSLLFATHPAIHSIGLSTIIGMTSTILITYSLQPLIFRLVMKNERLKRLILKK